MIDHQTALIVVKQLDEAELLSSAAKEVGFECELAPTPRLALAYLASNTPALVLLELAIDGPINGSDILYLIRSNPRMKSTKVIVLSSHPEMVRLVAHLADITLMKPFEIRHLQSILSGLHDAEQTRDDFRDPATGVYNRDFFYSRLKHASERARRRPEFIFGICLIQVKIVSPPTVRESPDILVINTLLRDATQCLQQNMRPTDTIARLGQSRFVILNEELRKPEDMQIIMNRIRTILTPPFPVEGHQYRLDFRLGSSTSRDFHAQPEDLIALAEKILELGE